MSRWREWIARCLLVLISIGVTISALELVLRVVLDRYRCDEQLGWTYRPGKRVVVFNWSGEFLHVVRFNRDGWREDREPPQTSAGEVFRIAVLGDSFSAGLQVRAEQSFPRLLEQRLQAAATPGSSIEVWNAAVDGFGTGQALRMFAQRTIHYRPRLVLLGVFLANDLGDNMPDGGSRNHYLASRCGRPYFEFGPTGALMEVVNVPARAPHPRGLVRILRRSQLYANLFPLSDDVPGSFSDWDVFSTRNAASVRAAWDLTKALIRELDRRVRESGGMLTVVLMPHEREARALSDRAAASNDGLDFDRAHVLAEEFLRQANIHYIDLYPPLRAAVASGEHPYLRRDMHWNRRGHQIVGDVIHGWLLEHCRELGLPVGDCMRRLGAGGATGARVIPTLHGDRA
jgi:hypothetical protein